MRTMHRGAERIVNNLPEPYKTKMKWLQVISYFGGRIGWISLIGYWLSLLGNIIFHLPLQSFLLIFSLGWIFGFGFSLGAGVLLTKKLMKKYQKDLINGVYSPNISQAMGAPSVVNQPNTASSVAVTMANNSAIVDDTGQPITKEETEAEKIMRELGYEPHTYVEKEDTDGMA